MSAGCSRPAKPAVWLVVWVSGRRPHLRLPQTGRASTLLMNQRRHANPVQRERGPENGHPDRLPYQENWMTDSPSGLTTVTARPNLQLIQQRKQRVIHNRLIRQTVGQTSKWRRCAPGTHSLAGVVDQVAR